jgi:TonB family protein
MKARTQSVFMRLSLFLIIIHAHGLIAQDDNTIYDSDVSVRSSEEMLYPPIARQARIQGIVVVRVMINDDGKVLSATAISGAKLLVPEALSNVKKWKFRANATKAAVIIYEFRLAEGKCNHETNHLFAFHEPNVALIVGCEQTSWQP